MFCMLRVARALDCLMPCGSRRCSACALALQRRSTATVRSYACTCQRDPRSTAAVPTMRTGPRSPSAAYLKAERAVPLEGRRQCCPLAHSGLALQAIPLIRLHSAAVRHAGGHCLLAERRKFQCGKAAMTVRERARCGDGSYEDTRDGKVGAAGRGALDGRLRHTSYTVQHTTERMDRGRTA